VTFKKHEIMVDKFGAKFAQQNHATVELNPDLIQVLNVNPVTKANRKGLSRVGMVGDLQSERLED
jgi:hypothetical protein